MQTAPVPLTRDLVLVGGGHAHALVLRRWGMTPLPGVRLTLINPGPTAPYTGMLPGFVAGHYRRGDLDIDLVRLARFAGARLILSEATGIDREARRIRVDGRPPVAYDVASIDVGITSDMVDLPGFAEYGTAAKPLGAFADRWARLRAGKGPLRIAVIGGGVAGVELAMAMAHALESDGREAEVAVIESGRALRALGPKAAAGLRRALSDLCVTLHQNVTPERVSGEGVMLAEGRLLPADFVVGAAGARPWPWLTETGLDLHNGFLRVDARLRTSDPAIFAAGDCAHLSHAPRPKAGVYAVRAAPVLTHNLRAALAGGAMRAFRPQRDYVKLVSLGRRAALFDKWGLTLQGPWLWQLKDRIDRRFMNRLSAMPALLRPAAPSVVARGVRDEIGTGAPPCAGCGAKVGAGVLSGSLAALSPASRPDIHSAPGDDAAILAVGGARQVITTDHLRAFTEDPWLLARVAAEHAMGDIWAMGAEPQAALATIILPRMSPELQRATLDEIMAGAEAAFAATGAAIVGGHTTLGAELTIGFTVTGLPAGAPITLDGGRAGDALLLTRPVGTGTILAAEMALKAPGGVVAGLLSEIVRSQRPAAEELRCAHAMTDVTGFGLAGHLRALARASGTGAEIDLDEVPLYPGARDLAAAGIRSTLYPANRALLEDVELPDTPEAALLFDPQTTGGLLAAVAEAEAGPLLDRLKALGFGARRIGRLTGGPPGTVTIR